MLKLFSGMNWILFWKYQDEEHRPYCEFMYEAIKSKASIQRSKNVDKKLCLAAQVIQESKYNEHFASLERFLKIILNGYYARRIDRIYKQRTCDGEIKSTIFEFIDGSYILAYPVTLGSNEIICLLYCKNRMDTQLNEVVYINSWG